MDSDAQDSDYENLDIDKTPLKEFDPLYSAPKGLNVDDEAVNNQKEEINDKVYEKIETKFQS